MEALGQDMPQETPDELVRVKPHRLPAVRAVDAIVFPAECDLCVLEADQTVIGYGNPVRIAAEIIQHLIRAAKGGFRVDHPFGLAAGSHPGFEVFRISSFAYLTVYPAWPLSSTLIFTVIFLSGLATLTSFVCAYERVKENNSRIPPTMFMVNV